MNRLAKFVFEHRVLAWLAILLGVGVAASLAFHLAREVRESERLALLRTEAGRRAVELSAQTMNGHLIGAITLLGLIDPEIKREAQGSPVPGGRVARVLESVGRTYDADAVFLVSGGGRVASLWDNAGRPASGIDAKGLAPVQMAMQGAASVHGAIDLQNGTRSIHLAAPVFVDTTNATDSVGALVARIGPLQIDDLLRDKADIALLLSPQGVVFASSRPEWIGHQAAATARAGARGARELPLLPIALADGVHGDDGRIAVARAPVQWNDAFGDWTLVLVEDLQRTVPLAERAAAAGLPAVLLALFGALLLKIFVSHYHQQRAADAIERAAAAQRAQAEHKERLALAALLLQNAKSVAELAHTFLGEMHRCHDALAGVVYVVDGSDPALLRCAGSFACAEEPPPTLAGGEGLLGQSLVDGVTRVIVDLPPARGEIRSGLGGMVPAALLLAPVVFNEGKLGAVELALTVAPDAAQRERIDELVRLLAMNLEILMRGAGSPRGTDAQSQSDFGFPQALFDALADPVWHKDAERRVRGCNRAFERVFGVPATEILGHSELDPLRLPKAAVEAIEAEERAALAASGAARVPCRVASGPAGSSRWRYRANAVVLPDGRCVGLVGSFVDAEAAEPALAGAETRP